jgi:hypothetical protein
LDVSIKVNNFPVIRNMAKLEGVVRNFKLREGFAAETSGGLAICIE